MQLLGRAPGLELGLAGWNRSANLRSGGSGLLWHRRALPRCRVGVRSRFTPLLSVSARLFFSHLRCMCSCRTLLSREFSLMLSLLLDGLLCRARFLSLSSCRLRLLLPLSLSGRTLLRCKFGLLPPLLLRGLLCRLKFGSLPGSHLRLLLPLSLSCQTLRFGLNLLLLPLLDRLLRLRPRLLALRIVLLVLLASRRTSDRQY